MNAQWFRGGLVFKTHRLLCHSREIGNLLPNIQRQRCTCYALCHILYPVSAALTSIFRMDSNSTSYSFLLFLPHSPRRSRRSCPFTPPLVSFFLVLPPHPLGEGGWPVGPGARRILPSFPPLSLLLPLPPHPPLLPPLNSELENNQEGQRTTTTSTTWGTTATRATSSTPSDVFNLRTTTWQKCEAVPRRART